MLEERDEVHDLVGATQLNDHRNSQPFLFFNQQDKEIRYVQGPESLE